MRTRANPRANSARSLTQKGKRHGFWSVALFLGAALAVFFAPVAFANDDSNPVVKVEEDWVVEIGEPNPLNDAPQIVSVISPANTLLGHHAVFELNHTSMPDYFSGGMQLQVWNFDDNLYFHSTPDTQLLSTQNETISFTIQMSLSDAKLQFEITDGDSTTWGHFGGQGYLKSFVTTTLTNLNGYSPDTSVEHSQIGYASNRVKRFVLKQVRYYKADGTVTTDTSERIVHQLATEADD